MDKFIAKIMKGKSSVIICDGFKAWKAGKGTRAAYHAAKHIARRAVHHACQEADKEVYKDIDPSLQKYSSSQTSLEECRRM